MRKPKYSKALCARAVALGKKGKSKAQIAAAFGVHRGTLYEWRDQFPEFAAALTLATELALAWWEDIGQRGMVERHQGRKINSHLWSRSMAARFPDDYRERNETTHEVGVSLAQLIAESYAKPPGDAGSS